MTNDLQAPDYLSDLPTDLIEKILALLPLKDAMKTSILSNKWRYRWTTRPRLNFHDQYMEFPEEEAIKSLSNLVTHVLLLHKGPIDRFKLLTAYDPNYTNLEQWLLVLFEKHISQLALEFRDFRWQTIPISPLMPSSLFSCQMLTHLKLNHCELNPPPDFKGFPCLKIMALIHISVSRSGLENIVNNCPLLEKFWWVGFGRLDMRVYAPKLKRLAMTIGSAGDICFENSPLLSKIFIVFSQEVGDKSSASNLAKFIGGVQSLEELYGFTSFIKVLSVGQLPAFVVYNHLRFIALKDVSFMDMASVAVVLHLMLNSPRLCELYICGNCKERTIPPEAAQVSSWDTIVPSNCCFKHLKVVRLKELIGLPLEMKFIEFMLNKTPAIKSIAITPCEHLEGEGINVSQQVLRLHRAIRPNANLFIDEP